MDAVTVPSSLAMAIHMLWPRRSPRRMSMLRKSADGSVWHVNARITVQRL
jgi:hypothetical protein